MRMVRLLDTEDSAMKNNNETISGQTNERNLVAAVEKYQPFEITLYGKKYMIVGSRQLGGGNPEPKADVALKLKNNKEIGISMKKPNFGFFESWMNADKTLNMLISVGIEKKEAQNIVNSLKAKAKKMSESATFKKEVISEYDTMIELVGKSHKIAKILKSGSTFNIKDISIPSTVAENVASLLLKDKEHRFGSLKIASSFKIENVYLPLNVLLGTNYSAFLQKVIGGGDTNPYKAEYILQSTISSSITESNLIKEIESSISVKDAVKKYSADDSTSLNFRLRPITAVRAAYSSTNSGKYKKGFQFYSDQNIGVSWTVHVAK